MCQRALDLPLRKKHIEVSVLHVFGHHAQRVGRNTDAQQPDDVRVVQTRHDLYFLKEVVPERQTVGGREEKALSDLATCVTLLFCFR